MWFNGMNAQSLIFCSFRIWIRLLVAGKWALLFQKAEVFRDNEISSQARESATDLSTPHKQSIKICGLAAAVLRYNPV